MNDTEVLAALDDPQALALTGWGEARAVPRLVASHSPIEELVAVMCVVRNRVRRLPGPPGTGDYKAVCLKPAQFSCWTAASGANHAAVLAQAGLVVVPALVAYLDPELRECLYLARGVISGALRDRTTGATSYYAPAAMIPIGRVPAWAVDKPTLLIGDQRFFTI